MGVVEGGTNGAQVGRGPMMERGRRMRYVLRALVVAEVADETNSRPGTKMRESEGDSDER